MDLTRLYQLTTDELRQAATRLGVHEADGLSRAQLIGAIRERTPSPTPRAPKGLFGRVVTIAKKAYDVVDQARGSTAPRPTPTTTRPSQPPQPAGEPRPTPPVGVFTSAPSAYRPNADLPDEPIITQTMARILAEQGHFRRSMAMYATLMREHPFDHRLRTEAEGVRSRARAGANLN